MELKFMSKEERSLLLFFECAAVDYGGLFQSTRMNTDDFAIAKLWDDSGFVKFGRIYSKDINLSEQYPRTHWVVLSDEAWKLAHEERRSRGDQNQARNQRNLLLE